jgi:hypothetical protein
MNATSYLRLATISNADNVTNCTVVLKSYTKDGI